MCQLADKARRKGRVHEDFITRMLADDFFAQPCPKSLDRNAFAFANIVLPNFGVADGAVTLSGLDRGLGRAHHSATAAGAVRLDRGGRRRAQSDLVRCLQIG